MAYTILTEWMNKDERAEFERTLRRKPESSRSSSSGSAPGRSSGTSELMALMAKASRQRR